MNPKSPECYTTEPQARCRRVAISPGRLRLLPLDQFAFAALTADNQEQRLDLAFATQEILVRGHALRRIETARHRLELSFVPQRPAKYLPRLAEGQPRIREIVGTEAKPGSEQSQRNCRPPVWIFRVTSEISLARGFGRRFGERESKAQAERQRERRRSATTVTKPQAESPPILRHPEYRA